MPCDEPQDCSKPKVIPLEVAALIAEAKASRSSSPYAKGSEDGEIVDHAEIDTSNKETVSTNVATTTTTTPTTTATPTDITIAAATIASDTASASVLSPDKISENTVLTKEAALARDHFKHNVCMCLVVSTRLYVCTCILRVCHARTHVRTLLLRVLYTFTRVKYICVSVGYFVFTSTCVSVDFFTTSLFY